MPTYDNTYTPPAAVLEVTVANPFTRPRRAVSGRAKIDSGADFSVIPENWAPYLRLKPLRRIGAKDYRGELQEHNTYIVKISFDGYGFDVETLATQRDTALIGRDVLNQLKLILDGRNLTFEIVE